MSPRERNLLILLVTMAFVAVNFLAYQMWYAPKMAEMKGAQETAEQKAKANEGISNIRGAFEKEIAWLDRFEPKPTSLGKMQTRIQQLSENEARSKGLTIKTNRFRDDVEGEGLDYHRARYEIEVNGTETQIYGWLDRLHNPNEFRVVTFIRLKPQRDDLTKADCQIYLDQYFVPESNQL